MYNYSVQFIVMSILQHRVKCVCSTLERRRGGQFFRMNRPLLSLFKACTMCHTVYCTLKQIINSIIYRIVYILLNITVFNSKYTRGSTVYFTLYQIINSLINRIIHSLVYICVFSSKGTRGKKKMFSRDQFGFACHFVVCVEYIIKYGEPHKVQ